MKIAKDRLGRIGSIVVWGLVLIILGIGFCLYRGAADKNVAHGSLLPAECYREVYEEALKNGELSTLETEKKIMDCLGEAGYPAVDYDNQIDMVQPEKVEEFCRRVEEKEKGEVTVFVVLDNGGYVRYEMHTENGEVAIAESILTWQDGEPRQGTADEYDAYSWEYAEKGYLFFEKYQPEGYDGATGHTALRVKPLDDTCRELNRKYILPIGYERNNMFIVDWKEQGWGELNFYDLYEIMYQMKYKEQADFDFEDMKEIRKMPAEDFEKVFQTYFAVESSDLKDSMTYDEENDSYSYRPRGIYERAATSCPRPEVTAYRENEDGTITLIVDAVWPERNLAQAFSHEVTIRPLPEGQFQYVSNRILPSPQNTPPTWYTERLPLT